MVLFIPCSASVTNTQDIKQNPFPGTVTSFIPILSISLLNWEMVIPCGFDANVSFILLSGAEGTSGLPSAGETVRELHFFLHD